MFEKFLSANVGDFRQRYEGTYGFYRNESKKRMLCRLQEVGNSRCVFVDRDGIEYTLNPDTQRDIGFEFLPPRSQWYNTQRGAVWSQRVAQRQFSRGITGKNVEIFILDAGGLVPTRVDFPILSDIFENTIKPAEAMSTLGDRSVAISNSFAMDKGGGVFVMREAIGKWTKKDKVFSFKLKEPELWKTEITDAVTALGYSAEIA